MCRKKKTDVIIHYVTYINCSSNKYLILREKYFVIYSLYHGFKQAINILHDAPLILRSFNESRDFALLPSQTSQYEVPLSLRRSCCSGRHSLSSFPQMTFVKWVEIFNIYLWPVSLITELSYRWSILCVRENTIDFRSSCSLAISCQYTSCRANPVSVINVLAFLGNKSTTLNKEE